MGASLLLVRHGQSTWNAIDRWPGQADPPLSDEGRRHAPSAGASAAVADIVISNRKLLQSVMLSHSAGENVAVELRTEEEWARRMMEAELGVPVIPFDDGSQPGLHDLEVRPQGDEPHAVEVTSDVDSSSMELWRIFNSDGRRIEPSLEGGWMVVLTPAARVRPLEVELLPLLQSLESTGLRHVRSSDRGFGPRMLQRLGVHALHRSGTDYPGSVYFTIEQPTHQTGGFVAEDPTTVAVWMSEFAASDLGSRKIDKLIRSGHRRRHLFVVVAGFSNVPFGVTYALMSDGMPTPTVDPELPNQLSDFWAVSGWAPGSGFRWSRGTGWHHFDKLNPRGA